MSIYANFTCEFIEPGVTTILIQVWDRADPQGHKSTIVVPDDCAHRWCINICDPYHAGLLNPDGNPAAWQDPAAYFDTKDEALEALCLYRLKAANQELE